MHFKGFALERNKKEEKPMKKILALVLALAMIATLGITSAFAEDDFVDGKFTTPHKITVEIFERPNDGNSDVTSNPFATYIKEGMLERYNVEVEFKPEGRWDEANDIPNLLADGKAADVSYTYNSGAVIAYSAMTDANGNPGIIDLTPYLEQYKDQLGDLIALLGGEEYLYYDKDPQSGATYMIEAIKPDLARITTFIRKDWLDALELAVPTTEKEFYNCLVAFRDNAEKLLGADASKMVPYSTSTDIGWRNDLLSISKVPEDITDEALFVYGYDDRHLLYPGYKEGIRVLNKWYNEGLVWKDFGEHTDATDEDNMMKAGYVGAFMHNWDYPYRNGEDSIANNLKRNVGENAEYIPIDCFKNDAGITRKYVGSPVGSDRKVFLPSTNKEVLASLLYINFISSQDVITFLQTGKEGVNYELTPEGAYKNLGATGEWIMNSGMNIDYTMTLNGYHLGDATDATRALAYPGIEPEMVTLANEYGYSNYRIAKHFNVGVVESETEVGGSLTSKRDELLTKAVTASVEDFDKVYDQYMADYMSIGGEDIINERIEKLQEIYGITFEK